MLRFKSLTFRVVHKQTAASSSARPARIGQHLFTAGSPNPMCTNPPRRSTQAPNLRMSIGHVSGGTGEDFGGGQGFPFGGVTTGGVTTGGRVTGGLRIGGRVTGGRVIGGLTGGRVTGGRVTGGLMGGSVTGGSVTGGFMGGSVTGGLMGGSVTGGLMGGSVTGGFTTGGRVIGGFTMGGREVFRWVVSAGHNYHSQELDLLKTPRTVK
ncbi:hypothetical protein L1887_11995 [Cichorium endivia]|nr:hypothetical protein L1887_11995 [Cichorium endivia]